MKCITERLKADIVDLLGKGRNIFDIGTVLQSITYLPHSALSLWKRNIDLTWSNSFSWLLALVPFLWYPSFSISILSVVSSFCTINQQYICKARANFYEMEWKNCSLYKMRRTWKSGRFKYDHSNHYWWLLFDTRNNFCVWKRNVILGKERGFFDYRSQRF